MSAAATAAPDARFAWHHWRTFGRAARRAGLPSVCRDLAAQALLALLAEAGWRRDRPAPPAHGTLLVVGHQRSGTTWLHRLLAAHPTAAAMPLHALLLPADTWQRRFARWRRPIWLARLEERLCGPLDSLHRLRLGEPEEDEFLLWALFRSPMNALDRPWPAPGAPADCEDDGALAFYAQAVAKAVRRSGRRHVGKNPHFTHRLPALRRVLDVRAVQLVRHPREAIASRLSLLEAIWRRRVPGLAGLAPEQVEQVYRNSCRAYLQGHGQADLELAFEDLRRDPVASLQRVHAAFDLEPPENELLARAAAQAGRIARAVPLERYGLDRERLAEDLRPVYTRWGFEP